MDSSIRNGNFEIYFEEIKYASELMLQYDNIKPFMFFDKTDMICDLNNYKDTIHYVGNVYSWILQQMGDGNYLITKDNLYERMDYIKDYYYNYDYDYDYDYDSLFE